MNNELRILGEKLIERKHAIARDIHKHRQKSTGINQITNLDDERAFAYRTEFIHLFGEILVQQPSLKEALETFGKWGSTTGEAASAMGIALDEALRSTSFYRSSLWEAIQEEIKAHNMSIDTVFNVIATLDPLLDEAVYTFSLSYIQEHQETLKKSNQAFLELSTPVVPITKGVAVLPLIGSMNTERARLLMEDVLQKASRLQLSHLLFDLSGVATVDTMVADQIFKVIHALSLLGVEASLIGIRPEVAQTMVTIGINIGELDVKANLETALKDLQQASHLFSL